MPRLGRLVLPNYPHHVVHRGHNRNGIFCRDADYSYYLENLAEWKTKLRCRLYAYCLMTNHVHLVVDPGDDARSLAQLMKRVAGRQTRYINRRMESSGTLWEGRYRSSIICKDTYFLACCRYVELNPVHAGLCSHPREYRWSSYREKILGGDLLDPDPAFMALGGTDETRRQAYEKWVLSQIPDGECSYIEDAIQRGHLTGGRALENAVADNLGMRPELRRPGRPRRKVD